MDDFNKVVVITQRVDDIEGRNERRDSLDQMLSQWVSSSGFIPVSIPNVFFKKDESDFKVKNEPFEDWLKNINPGALLLSGGNDIGEYVERDHTESYLLEWAKTMQLPVLGICRGLQMMATWAGGSLERVDGHVRLSHKIIRVNEADIFPETVKCFHEWGLASCPDEYDVIALSEGGVIEAIKHVELPWEGWMWHPEREDIFSEQDAKRLRNLFARNEHSSKV
jgi:N5-(cytidine 5'-diphosphoramidyl)-L-glutamine hydrolase